MIICEANFSSFAVKLNIISRLTAFYWKNYAERERDCCAEKPHLRLCAG